MSIGNFAGRSVRTLGLTAAIAATIGLTAVPRPAHALGTGAAVGIGVGALTLGTVLGATVANPYYYPNAYYYPPSYYCPPAPAYYPPAPAYPSNSCWSPYYQRYVPC
jgi:hypothetical protein